jgi:hypothetical protein
MHNAGWFMLITFTATCTYGLLSSFSPPGNWWLAPSGLTVFEFGAIKWLHYHRHKAENVQQMWISLVLTLWSGAAITAATLLELSFLLKIKGLLDVSTTTQTAVLYFVIVTVGVNVFAYLGCSLLSNEHQNKWHYMSHGVNQIVEGSIAPGMPPTNITLEEKLNLLQSRLDTFIAALPSPATATSNQDTEEVEAAPKGKRPRS